MKSLERLLYMSIGYAVLNWVDVRPRLPFLFLILLAQPSREVPSECYYLEKLRLFMLALGAILQAQTLLPPNHVTVQDSSGACGPEAP